MRKVLFTINILKGNSENDKIMFSFCSRRLMKFIKEKSIQGKWDYIYFPLDNVHFTVIGGYDAKLISSTGLILFTKE